MKSILQKLVETPGPSGYETEVRRIVRSEVEPYADDLQTDGLGNLIVRKGARKPGGCRILIAASLDEPGVLASHVDRRGYIRLEPLGNVAPDIWAGQRVRFLDGTPGVVGFDAPGDAGQTGDLNKLFIDLGAGENRAAVHLGDAAVFDVPYLDFGGRAAGKAVAARAGAVILIETLRRLHESPDGSPNELFFAFVTQEVVGGRAASSAAFRVAPDVALMLAAAPGDTPGSATTAPHLGAGPVIRVRGSALLCDPRVVSWLADTSQAAGIPVQMEVSEASSGARMIQLSGEGAAAGVLALAARYSGSPVEMIDWDDITRLADLLHALLLATLPF